jgi:hypothetical protein
MSVIEEIVTLEGVNLDDDIQCEIILVFPGESTRCTLPAGFRLRTVPCKCREVNIFFCCRPHKEMLERGHAACPFCNQVRQLGGVL